MTNYQQMLAQAQQMMCNQYNSPNLGGGSYMGSGSGNYTYPTTTTGILTTTGVGVGVYTYPVQTGVGTGPTGIGNVLMSPSGQKVSIAFTDMNGHTWSMDIDAAYVQILQAISFQHQSIFQYQPNLGMPLGMPSSPPAIKMLEGDFSEDEMSQAEQIIQEMNRDLQEPCDCEA